MLQTVAWEGNKGPILLSMKKKEYIAIVAKKKGRFSCLLDFLQSQKCVAFDVLDLLYIFLRKFLTQNTWKKMEVFLLASVDLGRAKSLKKQNTLVEMRYYVFSQTFIS